jgi:hypothetical protein
MFDKNHHHTREQKFDDLSKESNRMLWAMVKSHWKFYLLGAFLSATLFAGSIIAGTLIVKALW